MYATLFCTILDGNKALSKKKFPITSMCSMCVSDQGSITKCRDYLQTRRSIAIIGSLEKNTLAVKVRGEEEARFVPHLPGTSRGGAIGREV